MIRDRLPLLDIVGFTRLLDENIPQVRKAGIEVRSMEYGLCRVSVPPNTDLIRPGGTMSGPAMFTLADLALYGAVLSMVGPVVMTVTSHMNISFLRKPAAKPMIAEARILKLGKKLAYGDVVLHSEGEDDPVAHATGAYALPG